MNCEQYIQGICENDVFIESEILSNFYKVVEEFVETNNKLRKGEIFPQYIFKSVVGVLSMKFTMIVRRKQLTDKTRNYVFDDLLYYLTREIYQTEIRILSAAKRTKSFFGFVSSSTITIKDTQKVSTFYEKDFHELLTFREKELALVKKLMNNNAMDEFRNTYFDLAMDIISKTRSARERLSKIELKEYAKDIFSEATLKLISLVIEDKYVYEAKISSFLYWPMFNRWAKVSRELGLSFDESMLEHLPEDQRVYVETHLENEDLKRFMKENIAKLSKKEQEILWLKEVEGYSYQEIKDLLQMDEEINYLKQIKLRGKRNLEMFMKDDVRLKEFLS